MGFFNPYTKFMLIIVCLNLTLPWKYLVLQIIRPFMSLKYYVLITLGFYDSGARSDWIGVMQKPFGIDQKWRSQLFFSFWAFLAMSKKVVISLLLLHKFLENFWVNTNLQCLSLQVKLNHILSLFGFHWHRKVIKKTTSLL